jgi:hypothetical protein
MSVSLPDVTGLLTSVGIIVTGLASWRNGQRINTVHDAVDVVHKAVNSTAMDQNQRTDQLTAALTDANIDVPERPPPPTTPPDGT